MLTDGTRPDEAAFAVPRVPHDGAPGVAFPQPLRPSDVALMRRIFAYQAHGDIPEAVRSVLDLEDSLLVGTVLADRYLGRYHRSTAGELSDWLAHYADQPEAPAVHALLLTRLPKGAAPPPAPAAVPPIVAVETGPVADDIDPPRNDLKRDPVLDRSVLDRAQRGNMAVALRPIASARGISSAYAAQLRAEVAQVLFIRNEDADALRVAQLAVNDIAPADQPSLGFYIGGLAAWRLDQVGLARVLFEGGAKTQDASPRVHAASAFWASRASRAMHDAVGTVRWLHAAAEEPATLHGLLARRVLRMDTGLAPGRATLGQADVDAVAETPQGWRAFALLQVGQADRAEAELRALWSKAADNPVFGRSLLMVASAAGLADCATQMAASLRPADGGSGAEPRVSLPRLRPAGGFSIDPSLVYALARVESNFNPGAISPAGARGLMQIMPTTAQYITGNVAFDPDRLHEPASNLEIAQRYIAYLARQDGIDDDLIRVLASYNSGPGNFIRWGAGVHDQGDPLLFLEAIPIDETRAFVQHALLYSWLYAARMHLPAPSLDALAAGEFPRFSPALVAAKGAVQTRMAAGPTIRPRLASAGSIETGKPNAGSVRTKMAAATTGGPRIAIVGMTPGAILQDAAIPGAGNPTAASMTGWGPMRPTSYSFTPQAATGTMALMTPGPD
ncbi:MAG TPA: lytic transglycosylase domain-containing protein [Rhodopila sp.]